MSRLEKIQTDIEKLPLAELKEVDLFVDKLIKTKSTKKSGKLTFAWAGALKDLNISSVDLQHEILKERSK